MGAGRRTVRTSTAVIMLLVITACSVTGVTFYLWTATATPTNSAPATLALSAGAARGSFADITIDAATPGLTWERVLITIDGASAYAIEVRGQAIDVGVDDAPWDGARLAPKGALVSAGDTIHIDVSGVERDVIILALDSATHRALGGKILRGLG